jgi:8-oxo-dGTP pyrophosphatase MutT (NUDIX family)
MLRDLSEDEIHERLNARVEYGGLPPLADHLSEQPDSTSKSFPQNILSHIMRPAAVLIPLLRQTDGWHLLFIRRSEVVQDAHSGQVAFPGGRVEKSETLEEAALREAYEEVSIYPNDVNVLGKLTPLRTITNYIITPVVGIIPWPYAVQPEPKEVSRIFTIPLYWLANPKNHTERFWKRAPLLNRVKVIYFNPYDGETLWGASARITVNFLDILLN